MRRTPRHAQRSSASPSRTSNASSCARASGRAKRDAAHCSDCGRTPLIGEHVHLYARGAVVCELCRPRRRHPPEGSQPSATPSTARPSGCGCAPLRSIRGPVDPLINEITIARPREEVFDYLADIANHAEFSDHFLVDWRLTREDTYGVGAGARWKSKAPLQRFPWGDATIVEAERPRRIVEVGRTGKYNRIRTLSRLRARRRAAAGPACAHVRERAEAPARQVPRAPRSPRMAQAQASARRCAACSPSSRRTTGAARGRRSPAGRASRRPARRSAADAFLGPAPRRARRRYSSARDAPPPPDVPRRRRRRPGHLGLRQQGARDPPRHDRGRLPRPRRDEVPGADLAPAQPGEHRGPRTT